MLMSTSLSILPNKISSPQDFKLTRFDCIISVKTVSLDPYKALQHLGLNLNSLQTLSAANMCRRCDAFHKQFLLLISEFLITRY